MDSKSLMIGDWVERFGETFQIKPHQFTECNFMPIPLTAEILEKNGFRYMLSSRLVYIPDDGGCIKYDKITHYIYVSGDGTVQKNIGYVHQLQHALRLCGLTELADNFTIE